MSRRHRQAMGLIATVVAAGQVMTPGNAWAGGTAAPSVAVSAVGTVASVRTADSTIVVNRAYKFRDSRPKTVRFAVTSGTAVVVNGAAAGLGTVRAGMQVTVTGSQTSSTTVATKVVARR
ncbi:hypothetical protein AB0K00_14010 [Dactylosporangium sp. NPDC049525]|uniref:hypothetical protein n=1 Tax=Dactylosporangium sp. NPDC049525 TaxID=3154730 RepID=UPI00342E4FEA